MKQLALSLLLLLGTLIAIPAVQGAEPANMTLSSPDRELSALSPEEFDEFHAAIKPEEGQEPWLAVHWQTDLLTACDLAARENKPVFMWATNGFPLGCT